MLVVCFNHQVELVSELETNNIGVDKTRSYNQGDDRLSLTGVNTATVYTGILDVNNILIHVGQNLVIFLASTAVWMVLGTLNLGTARSGRSDDGGVVNWFSGNDFTWMLRTVADSADMISSFHHGL